MSWMWTRCDDGQVIAVVPMLVLTNVLVVDAKGYDLTQSQTDDLLHLSIARLPWMEAVASVLQRSLDQKLH